MATTTARQQPPWAAPQGTTKHPKLKVYNSLTRSKTPFVPSDPEGKRITWYACGPTVYDDAHLGHARNYVSTDILRRILKEYFNFDLHFVMNITDVDDKIIVRGRQQHLYSLYKDGNRYITTDVLEYVTIAYETYLEKNLPLLCEDHTPKPENFATEVQRIYGNILKGQALDGQGRPGEKEAKIVMHINTVFNTVKALLADLKLYTPDAFYNMVQDVMCPMLDEVFAEDISGDDHAIFTKLTKEFEDRFFRDMRELNVQDPDEIVRVTEYGGEIADFVDRIVKNKFGYPTTDGSVYFDIEAFEAAGNPYARLEPWNRNDKALQADGEGALTQKTTEKRSDSDFALWKASKIGEPSWSSPWCTGRPGWHIECSAMASAKLGKQMDIHSGGIDLAFPHHDNELAQSEAYWSDGDKRQWVNYFLHMGHLSIQGSKMSKSLKNFTTIRTALDRKDWTPRSLRIVFLLGDWRDGIEIAENLVQSGAAWEDKIDNFFLNVRETPHTYLSTGRKNVSSLIHELRATEQVVYDALCDSFNTPVAMAAISSLITKYNIADKATIPANDALAIGTFVTRMVNIFGLNGSAPPDSEEIGWRGIEIPDAAKPFVYPLSSMRDELREAAQSKGSVTKEEVQEIVEKHAPKATEAIGRSRPFAKVLDEFRKSAVAAVSAKSSSDGAKEVNPSKEILSLCDRVRDIDLWKLDIYLEDRPNAPALVRPVTAKLALDRQEKEAKAQAKQAEREKRAQEEGARAEKAKISHLEMYRTSEYSEWDNDGIPTRTTDGEEVAKSRRKRLQKDWERQKKAHEAWLAGKQH